jgi:pyrroline-5-carboxylate reductase
MNDRDIAFIGGGNMARSLIGGLVARGTPVAAIRVAEPVQALRDGLRRDFGVSAVADNAAVADAATWVLAVKPQVLRGVCEALAPLAQATRPLVVSIAAGITATQLQRWLGGGLAVVRCMPNTPALLGAGVTGLYANPQVDADGRQRVESLLAAAGKTVWLGDEAKMDAVTAVAGGGPAYVFLLAEAMQAAAIAEGLPEEAARMLVLQTILGAARMLTEGDAAIEALEAGGFGALVARAIDAATQRGRQLSAAND